MFEKSFFSQRNQKKKHFLELGEHTEQATEIKCFVCYYDGILQKLTEH